jgi:adenylosuccinate synthase
MLNSATQLAVTKVDVVFPECKGITRRDQLSDEAVTFINRIESETGVPVTLLGTGPSVNEIVDIRS